VEKQHADASTIGRVGVYETRLIAAKRSQVGDLRVAVSGALLNECIAAVSESLRKAVVRFVGQLDTSRTKNACSFRLPYR